LSNRFVSDWVRNNDVPLSRRITDKINPEPLREKVNKTVYRLNLVQRKLEDSRLRMEQKHKALFNKCVAAQQAKDSAVAIMYANECSQVRKMAQTVVTSQLAIEQVTLRLETVKDFGDIAIEVMPAAKLIHTPPAKTRNTSSRKPPSSPSKKSAPAFPHCRPPSPRREATAPRNR